jgi:hypothetical protein
METRGNTLLRKLAILTEDYITQPRRKLRDLTTQNETTREDAVRMDLRELCCEGVWIGFDWLRRGTGGKLL